MRRPARTKAQKQHDREQRALLRLRRAAIRYTVLGDEISGKTQDERIAQITELHLVDVDLHAACDHYAMTLSPRELRRLAR